MNFSVVTIQQGELTDINTLWLHDDNHEHDNYCVKIYWYI